MTDSPGRVSSLFHVLKDRLGGSRSIELPLSVYGKLPVYKDFLRSSLAGKEAQALKLWLDRGVSHFWGANESYKSQSMQPHGLLLSFPGTGKRVLAYLWGSHDQGNLRFFPFTVFVALPADRPPIPRASVVDLLGQFITHASRLRDELASLPSVDSFYKWARGQTVTLTVRPESEVGKDIAQELSGHTTEEFAAALYGDNAATCWPALLSYIRRHQEQARSGLHGVSLAVRLPSAEAEPALLWQVQLWCSFLRAGTNRKDERANLLVPLAGEQPGIIVLQRRMRPDDIYTLHPEMPGYEFIEDLRTEVPKSRQLNDNPEDGGPSETSLASLIGIGPGPS